MTFQDDEREKNMVRMFNLTQKKDRKRHEADAQLTFNGKVLNFELKSTTTESLSTVRDFGGDHVKKWKEMHWIVGFYDGNEREDPKYCVYLPPKEMSVWVDEKWDYVAPDYQIGTIAPQRLELEDMYAVCHAKEKYSLADAKRLHKSQYTKEKYIAEMDVPEAISRDNFYDLVSPRLLPDLSNFVDIGKDKFSREELEIIVRAQMESSFFQSALDGNKRIPCTAFSEMFPRSLVEVANDKASKKGLTLKQASMIMKRPLAKARHGEIFDVEPGYTPHKMLNIFRDRASYLIARGSTLNNPHIPGEFFAKFEKITEDHASKLRKMLEVDS